MLTFLAFLQFLCSIIAVRVVNLTHISMISTNTYHVDMCGKMIISSTKTGSTIKAYNITNQQLLYSTSVSYGDILDMKCW